MITEAKRRKADLIVMGGYGHLRLREWLLGGVTYNLMHEFSRSYPYCSLEPRRRAKLLRDP